MQMEHELSMVGELAAIRDLLEQIRDAVAAPHGLIEEFVPLSWAAGGYQDLDLKRTAGGVWLLNTSASTIYVGFAPGTGSAARGLLPVQANADLTVPFRCSFVSVGGPAAGSAVVAPLAGPAEPGT